MLVHIDDKRQSGFEIIEMCMKALKGMRFHHSTQL